MFSRAIPWGSQPQYNAPGSPDFVEVHNFSGPLPLFPAGTLAAGVGRAGRLIKVTTRNQLVRGVLMPRIAGQMSAVMIAEKYGNMAVASDFLYSENDGGGAGAGPYNYGFYESSSTGNMFAFVHNGTTGVSASGGTAWTANAGPQVWVFTYDGATIRLYLNGVQVGSAAQTGNVRRSATATLRCGGWAGATPNYGIYAGGVSPRAFTATEVAQKFSTLPAAWGSLFQPIQRRIWAPAAAAGGAFKGAWARQRSQIIGAGVH